MLAWIRAQQALTEDPGPDGDVVCDYAIAGVRERLRHARRSREAVEHGLRLHLAGDAECEAKALILTCILDAFSGNLCVPLVSLRKI